MQLTRYYVFSHLSFKPEMKKYYVQIVFISILVILVQHVTVFLPCLDYFNTFTPFIISEKELCTLTF